MTFRDLKHRIETMTAEELDQLVPFIADNPADSRELELLRNGAFEPIPFLNNWKEADGVQPNGYYFA